MRCRAFIRKTGLQTWMLVGGVIACAALAVSGQTTAPLILTGSSSAAYQPAPSSAMGEFQRLVAAKVDAQVLKAYIQNSPVTFNPTATDLINLSQQGVANDVLVALVNHGGDLARAGQIPAATAAPAPAYAPDYAPATYDYGPGVDYTYPSYYPYGVYDPGWYPYSYYGCGFGWPWSYGFSYYPWCFGNFGWNRGFRHDRDHDHDRFFHGFRGTSSFRGGRTTAFAPLTTGRSLGLAPRSFTAPSIPRSTSFSSFGRVSSFSRPTFTRAPTFSRAPSFSRGASFSSHVAVHSGGGFSGGFHGGFSGSSGGRRR